MNVAEVSLIIIAISAVAITAIAALFAVRLATFLRRMDGMAEKATLSVHRLDGLIDSVSKVVDDVARIERRIGEVTHVVLDEIEPPVRRVAAVLSGVRAGLDAFAQSRRSTKERASERMEGRKS